MEQEKDPSRLGRAEADKQFKVPDNEGDNKEDIASSQEAPKSYEESTPKVDNFSPPQGEQKDNIGGDSSGGSFEMPSSGQIKNQPPQESPKTQSIRTETEEEPEDVFEKKEETTTPAEPKVESGTTLKSVEPEPAGNDQGGGQKLDIPQEKKGYGCLWGIIAVLILVLIAVVIAINDLGILNLGLEKYYGAIHLERLWGGLPKESKMALADSAIKMKDKSFNIEGSDKATLTVETEEATATETPTASPSPTSTSGSAVQGVETTTKDTVSKIVKEGLEIQGEIKINAHIQNKNKIEVVLSTDVGSKAATILELLGNDTMIDMNFIYDSGDIYIKNASLKRILNLDKEWVKITNINAESTSSSKASKLSDLISGGERIGSEKINGVSCYVYEVKINNSAFEGLLSNSLPSLAWLGRDVSFSTAKFYLGKKDHFMHKAEINYSNNPGNITIKNKIVINFKNIGSNIQITTPSSEEVTEKNWGDIKNTFVSGTATATPTSTPTNTPQERDTLRKADLKKIQDALLAYKVKNGKYPSTSGVVEKTNADSSSLKTALVPEFLASLPVDPSNPQYYYGYKSDNGSKCELTSVLEVKTDPDGEDIGGYWIYKLSGN